MVQKSAVTNTISTMEQVEKFILWPFWFLIKSSGLF